MEKILVVGYVPYGYNKKLAEAYPNVIWFYNQDIDYTGAVALVELVGMVDGVMFMDSNRDNLAWEVACVWDFFALWGLKTRLHCGTKNTVARRLIRKKHLPPGQSFRD